MGGAGEARKSTYYLPGAQLTAGSLLPWVWGLVVKSVCSGAGSPGFKGHLGKVILSKALYLSEPHFLICKMGIIVGPPAVAYVNTTVTISSSLRRMPDLRVLDSVTTGSLAQPSCTEGVCAKHGVRE